MAVEGRGEAREGMGGEEGEETVICDHAGKFNYLIKMFFLQWKVQCFIIWMLVFHSFDSSLLSYTTQAEANAPRD